MKHGYVFAALVMVLLLASVGTLGADEVKNPNTLVRVVPGKAGSLDPVYAYDGYTIELIAQPLETLIGYNEGAADDFIPVLATQVPSAENGLISEDGLTYKFPIREGVSFTNGSPLTVEDVEYTFERALVINPSGGPIWMLAEVLLPGYTAESFEEIDRAIEVEDSMVVFNLRSPSTFFLKIVALTFCAIVDKETTVGLGGWPGTAETWQDYADLPLEDSVLANTIIGTGAFTLDSWTPGVEAVFSRNDDYWREPAELETVLLYRIDEWTTRRLMLENGDADIVDVPRQYLDQMEATDGVRVTRDLPLYTIAAVFLTRDIDMVDNTYVGSGTLGNGVPVDFFNSLDVRKGFNYAFDADAFIEDVYGGDALHPASCVPYGMAYFDEDLEPYSYDETLAEQYLKAASGGQVWDEGFTLTVSYVSGEAEAKSAAEILELGLESLNSKFQVDLQPLPMATFMDEFMAGRLPAFIWSWTADYLDPHNFTQPFMHSAGFYSDSQNITGYDELVEQGGTMADGPEREALYKQLQQICHDDAVSIFYAQPTSWHVSREWVRGWYPFIPQWSIEYYYPLSKSAE